MREGTPAVKLPNHVPEDVASARLQTLVDTVRGNSRRKNAARVGETHEVLVERPARRGGMLLARTRTNSLVLVDPAETAIGEYRTVRLTGTTGSTFTSQLVSGSPRPSLAVVG